MKNVPIKFRGKSIKNGNYIYGHYFVMYDAPYIHYVDNEGYHFEEEIALDSAARLVGYDAEGSEVYEGDILVNGSGKEFKASVKSVINSLGSPHYRSYLGNLNYRKYYRLKSR